jgi:subtilase family serine protease/pimeloyl-ACP methyl ester carboxylesterase
MKSFVGRLSVMAVVLGISLAALLPSAVSFAQTVSFSPATDFAVGANPYSVAIGDLNGDGKPDLAVRGGVYAGTGNISILLGTGTGSFGSAMNFGIGTVVYPNPLSVAIGDLNGDGKPDLATDVYSNTVSILLGTGTGSFGLPTNFTVEMNPVSIAIGDLNGDGKPDLVTANDSNNTASILLNSPPVQTYTLTLTTAGSGSGTTTGAGTYNYNQTATVTATANVGSAFTGWTGTDAAECGTSSVLMNANKSCTANFFAPPSPVPCVTSSSGLSTNCLSEADYNDPLGDRIPLLLIHGWNWASIPGPPDTSIWINFLLYFNADTSLKNKFKPYYFSYYSNDISTFDIGGDLRDVLDIQNSNDPTNFGSKPIMILAHSMGGLVARSFMQQYWQLEGAYAGQPGGDRVIKLITLATPHHGTPLANNPDGALGAKISVTGKLVDDIVNKHLPNYNQVNRSNLLWDNYNVPPLFDYQTFPNEQNSWLLNEMNSSTTYDGKIIAYYGTFPLIFSDVDALLCEYIYAINLDKVYCAGSAVLYNDLGLASDGIVPTKSAAFDGHLAQTRFFADYSHTEMATGQGDNILFEKIRQDLQSVVNPNQPDLIVYALSTTTTAITPGRTFSLSNTVKNQGTTPAVSSVAAFHLSTDSIYGNGDDIILSATQSVPSLAAGWSSTASTTLTVPSTTPLGNYYICAMADSGNVVAESNEGNNPSCTGSTIQVTQPDLIMTAVTPDAATVNAGATLSVTDTVRNQGLVASGSFRIAYHLSTDTVYGNGDDVAISTIRVVTGPFTAGATSTATTSLSIPSTTPGGTYYLCAMADSVYQVAESNEANNTLCSTLQVTVPFPDLFISAISTGATTVTKGTKFSLSFTINNQGGSMAGGFVTGFHLSADTNYGGGDDIPISQTLSLPSLGTGAGFSKLLSLVVPSTTPSGTYYVCGMTDTGLTVAESVETNNTNCTGATITVTP